MNLLQNLLKIFLFLYAHVKVNENVFFIFLKLSTSPLFEMNICIYQVNQQTFNVIKLGKLALLLLAQIFVCFFFYQSQLKLLLMIPRLSRRPAFLLCWNTKKKTTTFSISVPHYTLCRMFADTESLTNKAHVTRCNFKLDRAQPKTFAINYTVAIDAKGSRTTILQSLIWPVVLNNINSFESLINTILPQCHGILVWASSWM